MAIRHDDPRPPYVQLAGEIREAIASGEYSPGERLPSTRRLAEDNGISPMTVQHAMKVLRDEGLVVSQQGRGVFVQDPKADEAEASSTPKTLDEALALLEQVQARLDRLEATSPAAEADPGPTPEASTGVDV